MLAYLKESRGFDFTGYKRTSLARRVDRRMSQVGIGGYSDYVDHLQANSEEFIALFNTILINVTSFFRDRETWEYVRSDVVPTLLAARSPEDPVRIWSAGCASGEEAYTLAMVFAEAVGAVQFRQRVKIYATDVDEEALAQARQAAYPKSIVDDSVPEELLRKYFEPQGSQYVPQGPAPLGDLRTQRSRAGCPDLPDRSPGLPQHAHVLQRRHPGQDPGQAALRGWLLGD